MFKFGGCIAVLMGLAVAVAWLRSQNSRRLTGGYVLERFDENGKYYVSHGGEWSGGGTFDGTIDSIGWSDDRILAKVTRIYRGDRDGWYVLDVATGAIRGPLTEGEIDADPSLRGIACHPPSAK